MTQPRRRAGRWPGGPACGRAGPDSPAAGPTGCAPAGPRPARRAARSSDAALAAVITTVPAAVRADRTPGRPRSPARPPPSPEASSRARGQLGRPVTPAGAAGARASAGFRPGAAGARPFRCRCGGDVRASTAAGLTSLSCQRSVTRPASRAGSWSTNTTVPPSASRSATACVQHAARHGLSRPVHASSSTSRPGPGQQRLGDGDLLGHALGQRAHRHAGVLGRAEPLQALIDRRGQGRALQSVDPAQVGEVLARPRTGARPGTARARSRCAAARSPGRPTAGTLRPARAAGWTCRCRCGPPAGSAARRRTSRLTSRTIQGCRSP